MPTSYTATLDETPNMTTGQWVLESLSRQFGVCVTLRENGDMTEEQIEAHLQERVDEAGSYHIDALKKAGETLQKIGEDSDSFWPTEYASVVEHKEKYNRESIEEANTRKVKHDKARGDLIILRERTTDEATRNIAEFGLSQLELVKSETEPYITKIPTLEKFKENTIHQLNRDIEYHSKNLEADKKRERSRLEAYLKIKSEVAEILGHDSSTSKTKEAKN